MLNNVEYFGTAGQATYDNITRLMLFACWITKATSTRSDYVILITFPRQEWLRKRVPTFRLYVHCVSCFPTVGPITNFINNSPINVNTHSGYTSRGQDRSKDGYENSRVIECMRKGLHSGIRYYVMQYMYLPVPVAARSKA